MNEFPMIGYLDNPAFGPADWEEREPEEEDSFWDEYDPEPEDFSFFD